MSTSRVMMMVGAALAISVGTTAHAQVKKTTDFTVRSEAPAPNLPQVLKFDARKGRWGVTLNLQQPDGRDAKWNDVQAGAYFRVTPSLRVGGAVALGDKEIPLYKKTQPQDGAPRVRLETAFKF